MVKRDFLQCSLLIWKCKPETKPKVYISNEMAKPGPHGKHQEIHEEGRPEMLRLGWRTRRMGSSEQLPK